MYDSTTANRNTSYGPYELVSENRGKGRVFLSLPFQEVVGCQVMIAVTDNFDGIARPPEGAGPNRLWPGAEITIWGVVQGFETMIKRQLVRKLTGPMFHLFDFADGWDSINFRGRDAVGGAYNPNGLDFIVAGTTQPSIQANVYLKPRSGFSSPAKSAPANTPSTTTKIKMG